MNEFISSMITLDWKLQVGGNYFLKIFSPLQGDSFVVHCISKFNAELLFKIDVNKLIKIYWLHYSNRSVEQNYRKAI